MHERDLLIIPRPTNVVPTVPGAMARPTSSQVSGSFASILEETLVDLQKILSMHADLRTQSISLKGGTSWLKDQPRKSLKRRILGRHI